MTFQILFKILGGVVGTLGFCFIFKLKPKLLVFVACVSFVTGASYFLLYSLLENNDFLCNMIATFLGATLSEVFARVCKSPSTVFLLPGCLVLVPGGSLYYAMYNLMVSNTDEMFTHLMTAVIVGVGIGTGIILSSFFIYIVTAIVKEFKNHKNVV